MEATIILASVSQRHELRLQLGANQEATIYASVGQGAFGLAITEAGISSLNSSAAFRQAIEAISSSGMPLN